MAADPITKNTVSDLFNNDVSDDDDPFKDIDETLRVRDDKPTLSPRSAKRKAENDKENDILGLDEEVKITKKRKPIAKLDETRLLSQPGIPKLRALARSGQIAKKLHLKGKGHEFSDAAKLLNYYQLWLDNLYPRAKFADGLQLVEKAGHSKRMQTMRKEWIDEGKPGYAREKRPADPDVDRAGNHETLDADVGRDTKPAAGNEQAASRPVGDESASGEDADLDDLFFPDTNKKPGDDDDDAAPEEDELDALLAEHDNSRASQPKPAEAESEGEDDLDALLAEQDLRSHRPIPARASDAVSDEDDDLDALLAERDVVESGAEEVKARKEVVEDEDEPDAQEAERETGELDGADAGVGAGASSPFPTIGDEDCGLVT